MDELAGLSEEARKLALDRFRLLQPHLEQSRPLRLVALEAGLPFREIDVKQNWIVHLPEVAMDPGYIGFPQIRPYRFESGRLILSDIEKQDPSVARWKIIWEKVQ